MGYLSNVKKQFLISLFHSLIPAYVIERLFWQGRGIDVRMVVYCEIIYSATIILLEIPSGIMSDKFGRKRLLVMAGFLSALEVAILLFARSFWQFAAAIFLSGIGKALSSGSENALLYDSLLAENRQDGFEKLLGRLSAVDFAGSMIAALCGGVLASRFSFELNYIISFFSMCAALAVTLTLKEPPMLTKPESGISGALLHAKKSLGVFRLQPIMLVYCVTGAVLGACVIYLDEFWQLAMDAIGVPVLFFGLISALMMSIRIPGGLFAYKLKEKFSLRGILLWITAINAAGYVLISTIRNPLCLIPMALVLLTAGIADPLISGYLHHHIESEVRSTVESISSLGLRAVSAGIGLIFSFVSAKYSVFSGFLALGAICLLYLIPFGISARRLRR